MKDLSESFKTFKTKLKRGFKFKGEPHVLGDGKTEEREDVAPPELANIANSSLPGHAAEQAPPPRVAAQDAEREKVLQAALERQKPKKKPPAMKRMIRDFEDDNATTTAATAMHGPTAVASSIPDSCIEEIQLNLALLISQEAGQESASLMKRILLNIQGNPSEPKYQKLRLDNQKIAKAIAQVEGAVGFLKACGFAEKLEEGSKFLVFEGETKLSLLKEGLRRIEGLFPTPQEASPAAAGKKSCTPTSEVAG